ncbi:MAG: fimbrillin family protein [Bacteroides sp.]|nr:fimbrillin family protein [Bacteroides sp.]
MKIPSTHTILSTTIKVVSVGIMAVTAVACTDTAFDAPLSSQREIQFDVSISDKWNSLNDATRSSELTIPKVITLSSGEKTLYLVPTVEEGISISAPTSTTRGIQTSGDNITDFGVFASVVGSESGPDYMYNEEVTSERNWTTLHNYLWPGEGELHINAYSPYTGAPTTEGITSLPSPTAVGNLKIDYTVPAEVAKQQDLMWSNPCDASASPCDITFNHALTAIRFSAGSELAPCTVKEIAIKGVANTATLDLETGEWTTPTGSASYSVSPNLSLSATEGSEYVAYGTPIIDSDNTFLLMPQDLDADASVVLTIDTNGTETTLEASFDGQMWIPGKTITYHLSADPNQEVLVLDVTGDFASTYTGGTDNFAVTSNLIKGGQTIPVKWIAEFVDDNGIVIDRPDWITDMTDSGEGNSDCTAHTIIQEPIFNQLSQQSQILQNAADINSTSGNTPYNLSSSTGQATIENTANTYIINAPGKYSIPLVYGNAIKNGATNSSAYTSSSHNRYALKNFVNHLGNAITDPYIYNNSGCEPAEVMLIWEDALSLVRNVSLSSDKKSIEFDVPQNSIRQGNALIAVYDKDGSIMWSWQLWITDYTPANETIGINVSGKTHNIYTRSIGDIMGGDITDFQPRSVKVRFTQTDVPEGLEPLQKIVDFTQTGITISTPDCFTYYQWGRKDPMMSEMMQWYDKDHKEITSLKLNNIKNDLPDGQTIEQYWILTPNIFWESEHQFNFQYTNLWNTNLSESSPIKTIYDPSPLGSMVPLRTIFRSIIEDGTLTIESTATASRKIGYYFTLSDGEVYFPLFGYREGTSGGIGNVGIAGEYWSSYSVNRSESAALVLKAIDQKAPANIEQEPRAHGFGVRPMLEQ